MADNFLLDQLVINMAILRMLEIEEMKKRQEEREKRLRERQSWLNIVRRGNNCYPGHKQVYRSGYHKKKKKKKNKFADNDLFCEVAEEMTKWSTKDGTIETGKVKDTRILDSKRVVLDMVVSEDSAYLLCAEAGGDTSVWDLEFDINVLTYSGHSSEVIKVAISRDNQVILTAGNDRFLNVWQLGLVDQPMVRFNIDCLATHLHIRGDNKCVAVIGQSGDEEVVIMSFKLKNASEPAKY